MTRKQHMEWAKHRALEFVCNGDGAQAIQSMLSDLGKHPETAHGQMGCALAATAVDPSNMREVRRWVEGCN